MQNLPIREFSGSIREGNLLSSILWTLLCISFFSSTAVAQKSPYDIRVSDVRYNECLPLEPLDRLSEQYQIVIGAEDLLAGCSGVEVSLKEGRLADLFDLLVSQDSRYAWRYEGGVVVFYGRSGSPTIADLRIRHFEVHNVNRGEMYSALEDVEEIKKWLKENACQRSELFTIVGRPKEDKDHFSLIADDISLSDLLSRMALTSKSYRWAIHQNSGEDGQCRVQIYLGDALPVKFSSQAVK